MMRSIFFLMMFILASTNLHADYDREIRRQVEELQGRYEKGLESSYFHEMGILARKADEAGYNDLTTEIVGSLLFKKMDEYVDAEIMQINRLYITDPFKASMRLKDLQRHQRYYQPTAEYLSTTGGQAFKGELIRNRKTGLEQAALECSAQNTIDALAALRKSGVYVTNRPEEIRSLRDLTNEVNCCFRWKSKVNYYQSTEFESEYEAGTLVEESELYLKTSPNNLSDARWEGKWVYKFQGREGKAEAVSDATLVFRKGQDIASLKITPARVSSAGRINFPIAVSGDHRTLEVDGSFTHPQLHFPSGFKVLLVGCEENIVEKRK